MSPAKTIQASALAWLTLVAASAAHSESPPALRFDPFRTREKPVVTRPAPRANADRRAFEPVLVSTVVGGRRSVANLGGELLGVGEEAYGYRLVEVRAFEAVFQKDGRRIVLEVVGRQEENR